MMGDGATCRRRSVRVLRKLAGLVRQHNAELARLETLTKTDFDAAKIEIPTVANILDYYAGFTDKLTGDTLPSEAGVLRMTLRQPVGVVGAITPWNFPLLLATWKFAPALAMGNTVVHKPAQVSSLSALRFGKRPRAGVPAGVLNIVPGAGSVMGERLVTRPSIKSASRARPQSGSGSSERRKRSSVTRARRQVTQHHL